MQSSPVREPLSGETARPTEDVYDNVTLHGFPAPPLISGAATPPFPQGKDRLQRPIPDGVPPRSPSPTGKGLILSGLTRVTDVIYGKVPSSVPVQVPPKSPNPVHKIKKAKLKAKPAPPKIKSASVNSSIKPPLHPRTISMIDSTQLDSIAGDPAATPSDSLTQTYPLPGKVHLQSIPEALGKPTIATKPAPSPKQVRPSASDDVCKITVTLDDNGVTVSEENRALRCKIDNSIVTPQERSISKTESDLPSTGTSDNLYEDVTISEGVGHNSPLAERGALDDSFRSGRREGGGDYLQWRPLLSTNDDDLYDDIIIAEMQKSAELSSTEGSDRDVPQGHIDFEPQDIPDRLLLPTSSCTESDDDDLYDDIIVKKPPEDIYESDVSKLPEITELRNADDDLYDDIIITGMQNQRSVLSDAVAISVVGASQTNPADGGGAVATLGHVDSARATDTSNNDDVSDTEQKLAELNLSDGITCSDRDSPQPQIQTGASVKPKVPEKPSDIHLHPKVVEMLFLKKQKQLQKITEIYDMSPTDDNTDSEVEEIYLSSVDMEDSEDGEDKGRSKRRSGPAGESESSSQRNNGVNSKHVPGAAGVDESDEEEAYEELIIYEELEEKDSGYQDIEQAIIEALGLPQTIRHRSVRLVKGKERKRLRKSIKHRSLHLSKGSAEKAAFDPPTAQEVTASAGSVQGAIPEPKVAAISPESSSDEDDTHDGYMSHDKARQVLDMLLEANNVVRLARREKLLTVQKEQKEPPAPEADSHDITTDNSMMLPDPILPAGTEEYQKAGILQSKSFQEVAAEIKFLTDSAPKEPPPLPGVQRPRAKMVSRSDDQIRTRKVLMKTNTFPTYEYS